MISKFYKYFWCLPALILHELSHVIVALLLLGRITRVNIKRMDSVRIYISNLNTLIQVRLVAFSPFLVPLIFFLYSFKDSNFAWAILYLLSTPKTTLPSLVDFKTAKVQVPNFIKMFYDDKKEDLFDFPDENEISVDSTVK